MKLLVICCLVLLALPGCARIHSLTQPRNYQTVKASVHRNGFRAQNKNQQGLNLFYRGHIKEAEQAFQQALIADSSFGPAHNNLGKLYFQEREFYLAAWEFDYAIKLMPDRPEPHNNLGLIYDRVGKFDEAIMCFSEAYRLCPASSEYLGNLVRAKIARGERTIEVRQLLEDLILIEGRPDWEEWAAEQLALGKIDEFYWGSHSTLCDGEILLDGVIEESMLPFHFPHDGMMASPADGVLRSVEPSELIPPDVPYETIVPEEIFPELKPPANGKIKGSVIESYEN